MKVNNTSITCRFFIAAYKDRSDDTWFNICFVNNCNKHIEYLKVVSVELRNNKGEDSEVIAALTTEYAGILPGENLFLEKLDSIEDGTDEYRYTFNIECDGELINLNCTLNKRDLASECSKQNIPIIHEAGKVYLCA